MKNLILGIVVLYISTSFVTNHINNSTIQYRHMDNRLAYLVGDWKSTGFITDTKNIEQKIEINEKITAIDNEIRMVSDGINTFNGYQYKANKTLYFDAVLNDWFVKGTEGGKYTLNNKAYITENNTVTYSFYNSAKNLMRYTIEKENEDSFTETEEIWTKNGWDQTAWLRSQRVYKNKDYSVKGVKLSDYSQRTGKYDALDDRPIH